MHAMIDNSIFLSFQMHSSIAPQKMANTQIQGNVINFTNV